MQIAFAAYKILCSFCETEIEDEAHFLCFCSLYNELRQKYIHRYLQTEHSFTILMDCHEKNSSQNLPFFVFHACKKRDIYVLLKQTGYSPRIPVGSNVQRGMWPCVTTCYYEDRWGRDGWVGGDVGEGWGGRLERERERDVKSVFMLFTRFLCFPTHLRLGLPSIF